MTQHRIATPDEWLDARLELLKAEKELTRLSDELARQRRELPWVRVEKDYRFDTEQGEATLADLFHGRSQLIVYHFMYAPEWDEGCASCSCIAVNRLGGAFASFAGGGILTPMLRNCDSCPVGTGDVATGALEQLVNAKGK